MDGHTLIEDLKKGLMAAVRANPNKTEKEIFLEIETHMFQDHNVRVSPSWVRNMLYQTYDPSVIKALALYNVLKKMQLIQPVMEQEPRAADQGTNEAKDETRIADHEAKDEGEEPLIYLEMLKAGKI
jgi:hypothetical protein